MKTRAMRPCLDCGAPTYGSRCERDERLEDRRQHNPAYDTAEWRTLRTETLTRWRALHGNWCPGVEPEHEAHACADLTVDHITRLEDGGSLTGPVRVMCREWNGRLGARRAA